MKILILGGSGMLGHRLWINLREEHEVWVTVRGEGNPFPDVPEFPNNYIRYRTNARILSEITRAVASVQPDLVINCIGLIKQMGHLARDPLLSISLNALLPHHISLICRAANIRMIQVSTDCVFSGDKGNYTEEDQSDAKDLYGRTKFLGEVYYSHTITLRTSIIGQELKNHLGLIDWFLSQTGSINGYKRALYSGFTTGEIANIILKHVIPNPELSGLYHLSSEPISKFDLLELVKEIYQRELTILPDEEFIIDRSLDSTKFHKDTGYTPPSWPKMIREMAANSSLYQNIRG